MHHFTVFADYFSFIIQDEGATPDFSNVTDEVIERMIDVEEGAVSVTTVRNMNVPVEIDLLAQPPSDNTTDWDKINECSIAIPSGTLVILGNEFFPDAPRIEVTPGLYGVRVYYGNLDSLSPDDLDGDDHYRILLWPITEILPLRRIK